MNKPQKKYDNPKQIGNSNRGYNLACDKWELYHYTELEELNLKLYDRLVKLNKANKEIIRLRKRLEKKC